MKIDVEGFELAVLNGCGHFLDKVQAVFIEVGFVDSDIHKTSFRDMDIYLKAKGFVLSGYYDYFRWGRSKSKLGFANALYIRA